MWIFFHNYCKIVYYTMFTVRLHWIHTVLFTITLPSILTYFDVYMCFHFHNVNIFRTLLYNCLYTLLHWIFTITYDTDYNYSPQYTYFAVHMLSFSQCEYFPHITVQLSIYNVYIESSQFTYGTVYNYTTQYTDFVVYICFLFTMWILFHNYYQLTIPLFT